MTPLQLTLSKLIFLHPEVGDFVIDDSFILACQSIKSTAGNHDILKKYTYNSSFWSGQTYTILFNSMYLDVFVQGDDKQTPTISDYIKDTNAT